jgi:hypothetical protein
MKVSRLPNAVSLRALPQVNSLVEILASVGRHRFPFCGGAPRTDNDRLNDHDFQRFFTRRCRLSVKAGRNPMSASHLRMVRSVPKGDLSLKVVGRGERLKRGDRDLSKPGYAKTLFPLDTGTNIGARCVFDWLQWSTGLACFDRTTSMR